MTVIRQNIRVNISLPARLLNELDDFASAYGSTRSAIIRAAQRKTLPTSRLTRAEWAALKYQHEPWAQQKSDKMRQNED